MPHSTNRLPPTKSPRIDIPFLFDSYRDLILELGAMDGHSAAITLAVKHLLTEVAEHSDAQAFAVRLAQMHSIPTQYVDFKNLPSHSIKLLIVSTYQHAETFLDNFRREQILLGRTWRHRNDGESRLKFTLDCLPRGSHANILRVGQERFELFEYYRLVRNKFLHSSGNQNALESAFENVNQWKPIVEQQFGLNAPNPFGQLSFDDHMLFTRLAKYLATDICRLAPPLAPDEFVRLLLYALESNPRSIGTLLSNRSDETHLRRKVRGWFLNRYNYKIQADGEAMQAILEFANSVPNKRTRKRGNIGTAVTWVKSHAP